MLFARLSLCLLLWGLLAVWRSSAQGVTPSVPAQKAAPVKEEPFTNQLRKTVVFIETEFKKPDDTSWRLSGTGFLVLYPSEKLEHKGGQLYLVTNRHMAVPGVEEGKSYPVSQIYIRYNLKYSAQGVSAASKEAMMRDPQHPLKWFLPADDSVDLAVMPIGVGQQAEYKTISTDLFVTKEVMETAQIAPGDPVVFAGYFYQFPGTQRIQPIVRQGVLAMMPDEPIPTPLQNKPGNVYLVDAHAFHGNSGSPIFINTGGVRGNSFAGVSYHLLGVVSGYYPEDEKNFSVPAARVLTGEVHDNSGVTVVVPASELKLLLDSQDVKAARESAIDEYLKRNPAPK
jgi:hypothetical protein